MATKRFSLSSTTPGQNGAQDVTTTRGDLIVRGASALGRLALGAAKRIVSSDGADVAWSTIASVLADIGDTRGQLLRRGASAWEALAASTANTFIGGDGTDVTTRTATQVRTSLDIYRLVPIDGSDVAVWTLDDASGSTVTNTGTGSSANLTMSGNVTLGIPGMHTLAGRFYGGLAKGAASVQPTAAISVSAWVYLNAWPSSPTTYTRIVGRPVNGYTDPWYSVVLQLNSTGTIGAEVNSASSGTGGGVTSTDVVSLGCWHHVGLSYDGTTLIVYLDGTAIASVARTRTIGYTSNTNDVWSIGGNPATTESNVNGRVDDVRIASVARAASWWREVYQRGIGAWTP